MQAEVVSSLDVCSGTEFKRTSNLEAFVFHWNQNAREKQQVILSSGVGAQVVTLSGGCKSAVVWIQIHQHTFKYFGSIGFLLENLQLV